MQANIHSHFKIRKRPATDELPGHPSKSAARKLFEGDIAADHVRPKEIEPKKDDTIETPSEVNETSDDVPDRPTTPVQSPSTQESLRRELNLGEFKKVIHQHKKYTTLKEKLEKYNATASRLKQIQDCLNGTGTAELKKFDSIEVEVPSSPVKCGTLKPKRLFWTSPAKTLSLVLPNKYKLLKAIFRTVDVVTKFLERPSRSEMIVTFDVLKKEVQKMLNREFHENHLGQIKAVYPESYDFSRECIKMTFSNEEKYQLIVKRLSHIVKKDDDSEPIELTDSERLKIFHDRLLNKTKTYHQEFLSKLDPPIVLESDQLKTWHPEFELDKVPDVIPEALPPVPGEREIINAKSVLEKSHNMIVTKRMGKALESAVERKKADEEARSDKPSNTSNCPSSSPSPAALRPALQKALKNIPKSILDKVRAKQAAKMAEVMTQTPAKAKEAIMVSRLPELARIMRNVFVNEKRSVLPEEIVMMKICHSYREKIAHNDLREHLKLISEHVPGWMNIFIQSKISYVRLSKDSDMTRVLGKLQNLANT